MVDPSHERVNDSLVHAFSQKRKGDPYSREPSFLRASCGGIQLPAWGKHPQCIHGGDPFILTRLMEIDMVHRLGIPAFRRRSNQGSPDHLFPIGGGT